MTSTCARSARSKAQPEPLIELALRWLARRAPGERKEVAFLTGDAGQFVFEHGRVTAVLDLELACLGDPLADLGALRSRHRAARRSLRRGAAL